MHKTESVRQKILLLSPYSSHYWVMFLSIKVSSSAHLQLHFCKLLQTLMNFAKPTRQNCIEGICIWRPLQKFPGVCLLLNNLTASVWLHHRMVTAAASDFWDLIWIYVRKPPREHRRQKQAADAKRWRPLKCNARACVWEREKERERKCVANIFLIFAA